MHPDKVTCSTLVKTFVVSHNETEQRVATVLDLLERIRHTCSDTLLQNILGGCLAATLRLTPSTASIALAKRAFVGLACNGKMLASVSDMKNLLTTAASLACPPMPQLG